MTVSTTIPAEAGSPDVVLTPLEILHQKIAALKIRSEAEVERNDPTSATTSSTPPLSTSTSAATDLPLVPIFNLKNEPLEALCADSDNKRRTPQIVKTLRERGALRVLGAKACPAIAESIAELYDYHPNFTPATDYVLGEEILARQRSGAVSGLRLLLHGGAGVGKSDFSLTLAKLLGVPCEVISLSWCGTRTTAYSDSSIRRKPSGFWRPCGSA